MSLRVVFLDFDGVLNSEETVVPPGSELWSAAQLDPILVGRLDRLVQRTEVRVVISSSWRKIHAADILEQQLRSRGFSGSILGVTPKLYRGADGEPVVRGHEIANWLGANPSVEAYAILDDDESFLPEQEPHLVRTDPRWGLTENDVERALVCLAQRLPG